MLPALGILQRSSKWVGAGFSSRSESLSRRTSAPLPVTRRNGRCFYPTSSDSSLLVEEELRNCSRLRQQRCAAGCRAGEEVEVLGAPLLPRSLVWFESGKRHYSMDGLSSPSSAAELKIELASRFWEKSQKEAYSSLYHPFVVALAGGTLHISAFERYIAQDIYFLAAFAEAYGLASENTDDLEAKAVLQGLKQGVQFELDQVHLSIVGAHELVTAIRPNAATSAYTDFLLRVARGGDKELLQVNEGGDNETTAPLRRRRTAAYTIAAMTPCNRLYAFLGQQIKKAFKGEDTSSTAYAQWISTYASAEFGSIVVQCEQLLHGLAMPFPGEIDVAALERLYRRAMQLEVGFFDAQQLPPLSTNGRPVPVPLFLSELASHSHFVLVSDFDSTCTVSDSCPALADLSVATLKRKIAAGGPAMPSSSVESLRSRWDSLEDLYSQEYTQLLDRLLPAKEVNPGELQQQQGRAYNAETARQVLEALAEFEVTANKRVVDSGVLSGLSVTDVKEAGGTIPLRDGCNALLKRVSGEGLPLDFHILSVCWSRSFIGGSLLGGGLQFGNIHSNELQFNNQGISTGNILRRFQTALDKEKCFVDIVDRTEERLEENVSSKSAFTVYVGDSLTDLLCLLRADIGIVVGESSSLQRVAEAAGITLLPLYTGLLQQQELLAREEGAPVRTWTKRDGVLYKISNWHELHAFLLGS